MIEAALSYCARGWHVLPLACRGKEPTTGRGWHDATADAQKAAQWWRGAEQLNIGIALALSDLIAIDVDTPRPKNGMTDGRPVLAALESDLCPLPPSPTADTPTGGAHLLFLRPAGVELIGKIGKAIDVLGAKYIVAAPSVHPNGGIYRWRAGRGPDEIAVAALPQAWIDYLTRPEPAQRRAPSSVAVGDDFYEAIASLDQRRILECLSGSSLVNGERFAFKPTRAGKHNLLVDRGDGFEGTSNFIAADGTIGAHANGGAKDGGPTASSWLRWYGHDDKHIRRELPLLVPELERFRIDDERPKRTRREPPPDAPPSEGDGDDAPDESYAATLNDDEQADAEHFVYGSKGGIVDIPRNIRLAIRKVGASVSFDEFAREELVAGLAEHGPHLDDPACGELRLAIEERFAFKISKERFHDVVSALARRNRVHPVRAYLDALRWDGKPRIDRWLIEYAGAPDTSYVLAISRLVLVAAVRRVRSPGAKFDEMPILESEQGTNKSSALRTLAVRDEWFGDDLPLDGDTKTLIEQTGGKWIVEAGELKGMSRGDVAKLKACLSRQVDEARAAYGRKPSKVARQFVIIGTTNEKGGYLKDNTGNRRFWPVRVQAFDLGRLAADRDQLWAEAAVAEAAGESIRLDPALYAAAEVEQSEREIDDDPIEVALRDALGDRRGVIKTLDLWEILNVEPGRVTQDQNARLGAAMRRLGWDRSRRRADGDRRYVYTRGDSTEWITVDVSGFGEGRRVHVRGGES